MVNDSVIEILHHNRNRLKLIDIMQPILQQMMNVNIALALYYFNNFFTYITPDDESQVIINNYKTYIDPQIADIDTSCLYNIFDTGAVVSDLVKNIQKTSALNNPFLKAWLNDRGVSDEQIIKHNLIDLEYVKQYNLFEQNSTGATIHPALNNWISETEAPGRIPSGIMIPVCDIFENIIGCHNRFLSTVPKIKFASSIPNFHLFTNIRFGRSYKQIFIVEGIFDALALDSLNEDIGWISPSTGFWTEEQLIHLILLLQNFPDSQIITMFDNDRVGLKSNVLLCYTLNRIKIDTVIMNFPLGKDPSEAICKHHLTLKDLVEKSLKEAQLEYKNSSYEPFKKFEDYMDNRHASYSIENYRWS